MGELERRVTELESKAEVKELLIDLYSTRNQESFDEALTLNDH